VSPIRVIGLGAGGHAAVAIDALRLHGGFEVVGLLDPRPDLQGGEVEGVRVLGDDTMLPAVRIGGVGAAFIGVGSIGEMAARRRLYQTAVAGGFEMVRVIHPGASVAASARLGAGTMVMAGACINPGVTIGDNTIINTGAIVEHHCVVGDHVHVATGARLGGGVEIGEGSHIGIGATVLQGVRIGRDVIVGAGAVVIDAVSDGVVVAGVPACVIREKDRP
jgi:sugar O-acyltransferase (sialic acid O-acetyltransferase NeuD family)